MYSAEFLDEILTKQKSKRFEQCRGSSFY